MDADDRRYLCTALGFTVVLLRGDALSPGAQAARAHGIAQLIDAFCQETDAATLLDRMTAGFVAIMGQQGTCTQEDLVIRGFAAEDVNRCWKLIQALAAVERAH
jgi:hypothetical protein